MMSPSFSLICLTIFLSLLTSSTPQQFDAAFQPRPTFRPMIAPRFGQQAIRNPLGRQRGFTTTTNEDLGIHTTSSTVQPPKSVVMKAQDQHVDDWWYNMGNSWETSDNLAELSPYYAWYKETAFLMSLYGFAQHAGKINRGEFLDPELNMPKDRAFGYQSDFNPEDLNSGAFKHKPQGQKFRAREVHVNEGLASHVGEVRTMPTGQHVQEDGTILIQTSSKQKTPCHPNPCTNVRMTMCTVVNDVTAKCSRNKDFKLTLTWTDPKDDDMDNDLSLTLLPAFHNGSRCPQLEDDDLLLADHGECGAEMSEDGYTNWDYNPNLAEESATLTTLADGTKYQDYTYAILVFMGNWLNNLSEGVPQLIVEYDGVVQQELSIPQYDGTTNINSEWREYYFFGCFRPQLGRVDTNGSGFYNEKDDAEDVEDAVVIGDLDILHVGVCKALLDWSGGPGFNHYQQIDGDETNFPTII